jgi:mannose-6-phosphate isomerase-like protein (cupin superfamily)
MTGAEAHPRGADSPTLPAMRTAVDLSQTTLKGERLVLVEWTDPGGGSDPPTYIAPLHSHDAEDEAWYVLQGTLAFRVDGEEITAPAGAAVLAPAGSVHTYWNPRPEPARYVLAMGPRTHGLIEAIHAPDRGDMAALFARYDSTLIGWP